MRILVIHQYFLPEGGGGGSRFNELTRFWKQAGHDPVVVAGQVDHHKGTRDARYAGKFVLAEESAGARVLRAWVPGVYGSGFVGRALGFLAFAFSATWAALFHAGRPDVIVATSPPLVAALPGILVALLRRCPLVFEVRDLWPESAVATGVLRHDALLTRALYLLERVTYRLAKRIVVLTPAFQTDIVKRGLAPPEKLALVPNGADLDLFAPGPREGDERESRGWGDRFVALYAGAHGLANHLEQLLDAAQLLRDRPDILIATVGDGPERPRLEALAKSRGLGNIQFLGAVPKARMPALVQACDVGLAVLKDVDTFRTVYPNKVFDYMACARPVVLAIDGVARQLVVDEARAGVFVPPENGAAIAQVLGQLADSPDRCRQLGANGLDFVTRCCSRESLASKYLSLLEETVRPQAAVSEEAKPA